MKRNKTVVFLIFLTFFTISFITNILGSLNPDVIKSFNLNFTLSALLPFSFFAAYGVMSIPAGIIVEKFKERTTVLIAFIAAFIGSITFSLFPYYEVFICSLFLMGMGMAMLQVAINPLLRISGGEEHFAFNSVMAQLLFGGASFIAPLVLVDLVSRIHDDTELLGLNRIFRYLIEKELAWVAIYWVFSVLLIVMIFLFVITKIPVVKRTEEEKSGNWEVHKSLFRNKTVLLYFLGIFAYVGTEQGISYWISKFLLTYHGYDAHLIGASTVGWFWGMMSIGCLIGLGLLKIFDSRKILVGASALSFVFLSFALYGSGEMALLFFPLLGFSLSVMWSIIFSLALNSVESHHGSFSGILCTAIIGGAIVQLIVGWLGDLYGLKTGMSFIYLTLAYIFLIGIWAKPIIVNETIKMKSKKERN